MESLSAIFFNDGAFRSRNVSFALRSGSLDVPAAPPQLLADWQREVTAQLGLEPGDIEPMPLARTRARWPELRRGFKVVAQWFDELGLPGVLADSDVALMGSRGTRYHHDGALYGDKVFCNLILSDAGDTDLHFPAADRRIALARGTVVLFDPCQPHAIIRRGASGFDEADFAPEPMRPQVFLSWELPIDNDAVRLLLGIRLGLPPAQAAPMQEPQVLRDGAPVVLCPRSGAWLRHP